GTVAAALALLDAERCDVVIGIGGGSVLDTAKAVALSKTNPGPLKDYAGLGKVKNPPLPVIAIPTTAGTGSEVSRGALIVTQRDGVVRKTIVGGPPLAPSWAILDPELTLSLPAFLTAATAIDALSHAIEELASPAPHPVVAAIAEGALRLVVHHLPRVRVDPRDLEGRDALLSAAMMGGIGFEKGLGATHSLSHAIGALHPDAHHGALNGVLLPHVLRFNRESMNPDAIDAIARAMKIDARGTAAVDEAARLVESIARSLELPSRLRDLGVPAGIRGEAIDRALDDHCHKTNPRPCDTASFGEIWDAAY
ncbi:MAG TPA: iron-containing alcohol dehydrogenase, partial [Planctomycetota bacterium]|nr:iron-containing alcohol dehydrogenase [Planctomycetota bacterium]